jgi:hypothetical protein
VVNLPGVNTPQFDWARVHIPRKPRPVPPIVQPEVAADAIFRAAHERRREYWLGLSTAEVILSNMIGPELLDRYLARNAWSGQMTDQPVASTRRDNLEQPVHELHRTHGSFGCEAAQRAVDLPASTTRVAAVATGIVAAGLLAALARRALS